MNDKKSDRKSELRPGKALTVEDLAGVVGGAACTEEGTLKVGGEVKGRQRESRYPCAGDELVASS